MPHATTGASAASSPAISNKVSSGNVGVSSSQNARFTPISTRRRDWEDIKKGLIIAGKILLVTVVVAGLIAATIFTGGAAAGVVAAVSLGWTSFVLKGALIGATIGLSISAVAMPVIGYRMDMHKYTGEDLCDSAAFLGAAVATSAVVTSACALGGANDGAKLGILMGLFSVIYRKTREA
jgi:hypothetical protein